MLRYAFFGSVILIFGLVNQPLQAQVSPEKTSRPSVLYGVRLGLLIHDIGGLWSNTRSEGGMDVNAEVVFREPSFKLWEGTVLPNLGVSINSQGDTSKAYAGLLWEFLFSNGLFFNIGTGLAGHNGHLESDDADEKQLGSRILIRTPIEFGFTIFDRHRISILFDHISNADLAEPNEGLDTLGIRYGFQF